LGSLAQPTRPTRSADTVTDQKALKETYDDKIWEHLAGTNSAPFDSGEHEEIAVKVIDDRGNELLVVKSLKG
jgi:adenine-specific DNA-methyltransferase